MFRIMGLLKVSVWSPMIHMLQVTFLGSLANEPPSDVPFSIGMQLFQYSLFYYSIFHVLECPTTELHKGFSIQSCNPINTHTKLKSTSDMLHLGLFSHFLIFANRQNFPQKNFSQFFFLNPLWIRSPTTLWCYLHFGWQRECILQRCGSGCGSGCCLDFNIHYTPVYIA